MNMLVGAATISAATPIPHSYAGDTNLDGELISLTRKFLDLLPDYELALARASDLASEYDDRIPTKPATLRWRMGDTVGVTREDRGAWCNNYGIARNRGKKQYDWHLKDEHEEEFFALPKDQHLLEYGEPKLSVQHMFSKKFSKRKQNRMNKLIAALDQHHTECDALYEEIGCKEADRALEELADPIYDIVDEIDEIEPVTVAGIQAKATILLKWYWRDRDIDDLTFQDGLAHQLISKLASSPITI
ncbi:hypothetical protein [Tardiphaga sp. 285_C5_N1_2]|uniref:hypothetical protein n=1 Tax=Tardiphaga sp. 285_C5_N1_2 TaxID=3240775 RepID=UPI003F8A972A